MTDDTNDTDREQPPRSDLVFVQGLDVCGAVVADIAPDEWDLPSPCDGWTAEDVLGHVTTTMRMGLSIMRGEEPEWPDVERPADLVSEDPAAMWSDLAGELRSALDGAELDSVRDTPMGPRTVAEGLAFPAIDLYVHAWDISKAAGRPIEIPSEPIELAHHHIDPIPEDMARGPKGAFGPRVDHPADATPTEEFIAWTGRDPR